MYGNDSETPRQEGAAAQGEGQVQPAMDVNTGADTSAAPNNDVNSADASSTPAPSDENASASSTDTGVKENQDPPTLGERLSAAIDKMTGKGQTEASPAAETPTEPEEVKSEVPEQEPQDQNEEVSAEEKAATEEWRSNPATKRVLNERKQARQQRDEAIEQGQTYEADAKRHHQVQDYLKKNSVTDQDAANALRLAALAIKDPRAFQEEIATMAKTWGNHTGVELSAELQAEVDQGLISPERAQQLSNAEGDTRMAQQANQINQQASQQQHQQNTTQHAQQLFTNWEAQVARTDPHLNDKLPMITDRLTQMRMAQGDPKDANDAWERLNKAHTDVTATIQKFQPARPPTAPSPKPSGTTQGPATPPANFDEALSHGIDQILAGAQSQQ